MENIKILYIDDSPDTALSKYLDQFNKDGYEFDYSDLKFFPDKGYESLINDPDVQGANIIFIDSRLFENRNANIGKFTGEEFKIILKKYFPFIEVVVVTQNEIETDFGTIAKYNTKFNKSAEEYYNDVIPPRINNALSSISEIRKIVSLFEKNTSWESVLIEKITNSVNGCGKYDELTKHDIDNVIIAFKDLQEKIDGEGL